MYLSKMTLDPSRRKTQKALASPRVLHAMLLNAWSGRVSGVEGPRVLWRLDEGRTLYVVSPQKPDLGSVTKQVGAWGNDPLTRDYTPLLNRLSTKQQWRFRIKVNPTVVITRGGKKRRVPHENKTEWLLGLSERLGVDDMHVRLSKAGTEQFGRYSGKVTLAGATFDGMFTVADPNALRTALTHGVGRGKGFGLGLMTLAPLEG